MSDAKWLARAAFRLLLSGFCLPPSTFCLLCAGCAGDRRMAAGDPLLGGPAPATVNPQAPGLSPGPQPIASAGPAPAAVPPLPPMSPTASNAALAAAGPPQPLDGGRDLRISDTRPPG